MALVQFSSGSYSVLENAGIVRVCLNKTLPTPQDFSVTFSPGELTPRSAQGNQSKLPRVELCHKHLDLITTARRDFVGNNITATFPVEASQLCVNITIIDDFIALEPNREFRVTFSIPSQPWLQGAQESRITIIESDGEA